MFPISSASGEPSPSRINHRAIDPGEDTTPVYDMSIIGDCTDIDEAAACDPWVMALAPGVAHAHQYDRERDTDLLTDATSRAPRASPIGNASNERGAQLRSL